jgi:hypothetical protein
MFSMSKKDVEKTSLDDCVYIFRSRVCRSSQLIIIQLRSDIVPNAPATIDDGNYALAPAPQSKVSDCIDIESIFF